MPVQQSQIKNQESEIAQLCAWSVHLYTALGLVAAAGIAVLIVHGGTIAFRWAFLLMLVATLIDASDGTLARLARVKEVLPGFDGRRLDDIVDFLNYAALPLLLVWRAEILPGWLSLWLLVPLVASAYGFCQVAIKTDDGFFLGFPSYWNMVAFYLYFLQPPVWASLSLLLTLAALTFVPTRYLYPSQPGRLNQLTAIAGIVWVCLPVWVLFQVPDASVSPSPASDNQTRGLTLVSLFFPVYYMVSSWMISVKIWLASRRPTISSPAPSVPDHICETRT